MRDADLMHARGIDQGALLELGRHLLARGYRFVTPTPATHARVNARPDNAWAADLRGLFGWSRPVRDADAGGELGEAVALMRRAGIARRCEGAWRSTLRASTLGSALYFHSAYPTDDADAVFFGPDTYRFVRALLAAPAGAQVRRIVDIGSGAGPAAIALALCHRQADVIAADINPCALLLAGVNARLAGAANVQVCHSDVLSGVDGQFDLIVCNPPYMADDKARAYRDGGAGLGAALSLRIVEEACPRLAPGGELRLYTGSAIVDGHDALCEQAGAVLERAGLAWRYEEIDPDVFGEELERPAYGKVERIAAVMLSARR